MVIVSSRPWVFKLVVTLVVVEADLDAGVDAGASFRRDDLHDVSRFLLHEQQLLVVLKEAEDTLPIVSQEVSLSIGVRTFVELNTGSKASEENEEAREVSSIDLFRFFSFFLYAETS